MINTRKHVKYHHLKAIVSEFLQECYFFVNLFINIYKYYFMHFFTKMTFSCVKGNF